jgi:hypothetical protein
VLVELKTGSRSRCFCVFDGQYDRRAAQARCDRLAQCLQTLQALANSQISGSRAKITNNYGFCYRPVMSDASTIEAKYRRCLDGWMRPRWRNGCHRASLAGRHSTVAKALGMSRTTIHTGLAEIKKAAALGQGCAGSDQVLQPIARATGGGRKLTSKDDSLLQDCISGAHHTQGTCRRRAGPVAPGCGAQ